MAERFQVRCVTRDKEDRIAYIGGDSPDGRRWLVSVEEAIRNIKSGLWQLFVSNGIDETNVAAVAGSHGTEYLRTVSDNTESNNLSSLPPCGV